MRNRGWTGNRRGPRRSFGRYRCGLPMGCYGSHVFCPTMGRASLLPLSACVADRGHPLVVMRRGSSTCPSLYLYGNLEVNGLDRAIRGHGLQYVVSAFKQARLATHDTAAGSDSIEALGGGGGSCSMG